MRGCYVIPVNWESAASFQQCGLWRVPTKDVTGRCLFCLAIDLRAVCICSQLVKYVTILLMLRYVKSKAGKDGLINSLGLAVCLGKVRQRPLVLDAQ